MSERTGNVTWETAKAAGSWALLLLLTTATHGGIANALGASGPPPHRAPMSPFRAASQPPLDLPSEGGVPEAPADGSRRPGTTPMPAPAPTTHYAGSKSRPVNSQFATGLGKRRSISFFTTA